MDILKEFETFLLEEEKSIHTIEGYSTDVRLFLEYIEKDITELQRADLVKYKKFMLSNKSDLKRKSAARKLTSIKSFSNFLREKKDIHFDTNVSKIEVPERQVFCDSELIHYPEFLEIVKLTEELKDYRAKALFCCYTFTGTRVSELIQLTKDITKQEKKLFNIKGFEFEAISTNIIGKKDKERAIFLFDDIIEIIEEYLPHREDTGNALFTGQRGNTTRSGAYDIFVRYDKLAKERGILHPSKKWHPHKARHLFTKHLIDSGYRDDLVATLTGHSDINTLKIYTRRTESECVCTVKSAFSLT